MPNFTDKEKKQIARLVKNYRDMDNMRDEVKETIDEALKELAVYISKNYTAFLKNTGKVMKEFAKEYMKKHNKVFDKAMNEGLDLGKDLLKNV